MKRSLAGSCLTFVVAAAIGVSAQAPPQPAKPDMPSAQASVDKEVKLTGCLKAGADAGSFELATGKKATKAGTDAAATSQTPPASGQAPTQAAMASAGMGKNVKLTAAPGVDLAAHLNHQIQVAGSWSAAADAAKGKSFAVSSVKMIAATCTTGTN
jgi:hypothetical protein